MKYHIDTIPVWDAVKADGECPLCDIHRNKEEALVDSVLGGAVMEPDRRIETNREGFCPRHHRMLHEKQSRLAHALMSHTHLKDVLGDAFDAQRHLQEAVAREQKKTIGRRAAAVLLRKGDASGAAREAARIIRARGKTCHMCRRMDETMKRYTASYVYLWEKEREFQEAVCASKGLCLEHYADVLDMAAELLSGEQLMALLERLPDVEMRKLEKIEKDLERFTQKFDYRNADKPWGESRDALERTMSALRGPNAPHGGRKKDENA